MSECLDHFNLKQCIIYAQTSMVDMDIVQKKMLFIASQHEVRAAVQALVNLYCKEMQFREEYSCSYTRVFHISEKNASSSDFLEEIVTEAVNRGYALPLFDAVIVGISHRRDVEFTPLFNLDKVLGEYNLQRFDPL